VSGAGNVAAVVEVVVFEHEIPTVEAIFTSVGNEVAFEPDSILTRRREKKAAPTAIDTSDLRVRLKHPLSMPLPGVACWDARCGWGTSWSAIRSAAR
jgi:hypothetical protein